ncbi:hypothetical protein MD484_g3009, partial [Candolleomyces efflorescens]
MLPSFLLALTWAVLVAAADYYKVLDVHRSASDKDIRTAYKRLSKKWHPDKNKSAGAEDKFVEIARGTIRGLIRLDSELLNVFGEISPKSRLRNGKYMTVTASYAGGSIDFMVNKKILCDHCRGSGAATDGDIHTCTSCNGQGVKLIKQQIFPGMFAQSQVTCNECGGRGKIIKRRCPHCQGNKVMDHTAHYTLEVDAGMPEGHEVVFEGEADESPDWEAGDIVLRVRTKKEKGGFRRKETSLYWKETIGVDEALLGFERNLTHLDGHVVPIKRNGVTQPGYVQVIKGQGMPVFNRHDQFGDLFVEYNVVLPAEVSPQMRRKLSEAFQSASSSHDEL